MLCCSYCYVYLHVFSCIPVLLFTDESKIPQKKVKALEIINGTYQRDRNIP